VKLKLDENIPRSSQARLEALGFDTDTVLGESLKGRPDGDVWNATQAAGRVLVTQDLDFSDVRKFTPGTHHGIVVLRLPDSEHWRIGDYLVAWFSTPEARTWGRCFVVATPNKVRVLRPTKDADG